MFWCAIQSDGQKMLVKCPNNLNAACYFIKKLKNCEGKMHHLAWFFIKKMLLCISLILSAIFSQREREEHAGMVGI